VCTERLPFPSDYLLSMWSILLRSPESENYKTVKRTFYFSHTVNQTAHYIPFTGRKHQQAPRTWLDFRSQLMVTELAAEGGQRWLHFGFH